MPDTRSKRIPVAKLSANGELLAVYPSARKAAKANFMSGQTVTNHCNEKTNEILAPDGNRYVWDSDLEYSKNTDRQEGGQMRYATPKCCNQSLTLFTYLEVSTMVRKDGKPSLQSPQVFSYKPNKLWCRRCDSRYEPTIDGKGRVVKGELIGG